MIQPATWEDVQRVQRQLEGVQAELRDLRTREKTLTPLAAPFLTLPGLVGLWAMGSVQRSTGNVYDLSGQGRTLTYNGNPTFNVHNNLAPYLDLDGTGDYLSRVDETDLDILGTETIYASAVRGLTVGGWFWSDSIATQQALMGKYLAAGNQRSYWMQFLSSQVDVSVSVDGAAVAATVATSASLVSGAWNFCVGRFTPSVELKAFVNGASAVNTTGIPASIFNGTADLDMGALSGGTFTLNGRVALGFLCANAVSDALLSQVFQATRHYFGV